MRAFFALAAATTWLLAAALGTELGAQSPAPWPGGPACEPREGYTLPTLETLERRLEQYANERRKVCFVARIEVLSSVNAKYVNLDRPAGVKPALWGPHLELAPLKEEMQDWILQYCEGQGTGNECTFAIYGTIMPYENYAGHYFIRPDVLVADPAAYAR